jgi:hypothetical protein
MVVPAAAHPSEVVTALTGFLTEHQHEQVVVEWRVDE